MAELLLGELEVQATGNEGDEQRVLGDALSLRCLGDRHGEILREPDEFVGGHGGKDSTCASDSVLVSSLSRKRAGGATNTPAPAKETELPMQAQASAPKRNLVSEYFNEPIFYGGLICTRAEAIEDMRAQGLPERCIDRYLQGNASTPFPPDAPPEDYDGPVAYPIGITPAARGEGPAESIAHYFEPHQDRGSVR